LTYLSLLSLLPSPSTTLFPYTTLFRSVSLRLVVQHLQLEMHSDHVNNASYNSLPSMDRCPGSLLNFFRFPPYYSFEASWFYLIRSEEHTSELQSRFDLVCRLLLEKKTK